MNLLVDRFPTAVEIDGQETPINTDFRACLRVILAFEDPELAGIERQIVLLENLYSEVPENTQAALEQGMKFLNGGKSDEGEDEGNAAHRVFSFSKDADLIFAAFQQTHGIDLETTEMHWWKFMALFGDLGADTAFCNLVSLRKRVKTHKATKEEKAAAHEMGERFDIPDLDDRTVEERDKADEFMRLLGMGEKT